MKLNLKFALVISTVFAVALIIIGSFVYANSGKAEKAVVLKSEATSAKTDNAPRNVIGGGTETETDKKEPESGNNGDGTTETSTDTSSNGKNGNGAGKLGAKKVNNPKSQKSDGSDTDSDSSSTDSESEPKNKKSENSNTNNPIPASMNPTTSSNNQTIGNGNSGSADANNTAQTGTANTRSSGTIGTINPALAPPNNTGTSGNEILDPNNNTSHAANENVNIVADASTSSGNNQSSNGNNGTGNPIVIQTTEIVNDVSIDEDSNATESEDDQNPSINNFNPDQSLTSDVEDTEEPEINNDNGNTGSQVESATGSDDENIVTDERTESDHEHNQENIDEGESSDQNLIDGTGFDDNNDNGGSESVDSEPDTDIGSNSSNFATNATNEADTTVVQIQTNNTGPVADGQEDNIIAPLPTTETQAPLQNTENQVVSYSASTDDDSNVAQNDTLNTEPEPQYILVDENAVTLIGTDANNNVNTESTISTTSLTSNVESYNQVLIEEGTMVGTQAGIVQAQGNAATNTFDGQSLPAENNEESIQVPYDRFNIVDEYAAQPKSTNIQNSAADNVESNTGVNSVEGADSEAGDKTAESKTDVNSANDDIEQITIESNTEAYGAEFKTGINYGDANAETNTGDNSVEAVIEKTTAETKVEDIKNTGAVDNMGATGQAEGPTEVKSYGSNAEETKTAVNYAGPDAEGHIAETKSEVYIAETKNNKNVEDTADDKSAAYNDDESNPVNLI